MYQERIALIIADNGLEELFDAKVQALETFVRGDDGVVQDETRRAAEDQLGFLKRHRKIFIEDMAEYLLCHFWNILSWRDQVPRNHPEQQGNHMPLFEGAYSTVLWVKQLAMNLAVHNPDIYRREAMTYHKSWRLGWREGQSEEYCIVKRKWYERIDTVPMVLPIPQYTIPSKVQMFRIIPLALDGEELSYLFGVESPLLADFHNVLTIHENLAKLLSTGAAVIVPIPPDDGNQIRWKFVLTWKPTEDNLWNGVEQKRTYEEFNGQELKFNGTTHPAARFLYFRFMLTYMYWLTREDDWWNTDGALDWLQELEKENDGSLWAVSGLYLRRRFFGKLSSLICGRALPLPDYKDCTFRNLQGLRDRSPNEENKLAESLKEKIVQFIYKREGRPEAVNGLEDPEFEILTE